MSSQKSAVSSRLRAMHEAAKAGSVYKSYSTEGAEDEEANPDEDEKDVAEKAKH